MAKLAKSSVVKSWMMHANKTTRVAKIEHDKVKGSNSCEVERGNKCVENLEYS
jgi:hypothetical protein